MSDKTQHYRHVGDGRIELWEGTNPGRKLRDVGSMHMSFHDRDRIMSGANAELAAPSEGVEVRTVAPTFDQVFAALEPQYGAEHLDDLVGKAKAVMALYTAPGPSVEPVTWQPIETAPKDGTVILGALPGSDVPHPVYYGNHKRGQTGSSVVWRTSWDRWALPVQDRPTHWMPLPAAPEKVS